LGRFLFGRKSPAAAQCGNANSKALDRLWNAVEDDCKALTAFAIAVSADCRKALVFKFGTGGGMNRYFPHAA
jgi:hypothetical protein